jgi:hypothetical protein
MNFIANQMALLSLGSLRIELWKIHFHNKASVKVTSI